MKRLALVCLVAYFAAQTFQEYVFAVLTAAGADVTAWRVALDPLNRARAFLLLASFVPLMIAFTVICALKLRTAPRRALVAGVFLLAFCFFEISYRSIEFFVVDGIWTRTLLETSDAAVRETMQTRLDVFADVVRGIYFPLMLTHLVGSVFLFVTTFPAARADLLLRAATAITALRLVARLASTYADVTWLSAFNDRLYFPVVFLSLVALILYLWRADDLPEPGRSAV